MWAKWNSTDEMCLVGYVIFTPGGLLRWRLCWYYVSFSLTFNINLCKYSCQIKGENLTCIKNILPKEYAGEFWFISKNVRLLALWIEFFQTASTVCLHQSEQMACQNQDCSKLWLGSGYFDTSAICEALLIRYSGKRNAALGFIMARWKHSTPPTH